MTCDRDAVRIARAVPGSDGPAGQVPNGMRSPAQRPVQESLRRVYAAGRQGARSVGGFNMRVRAKGSVKRPTRRELELLRLLIAGRWVGDEAASTNYSPGTVGRTEGVLCRMADKGWVDWSEGVDAIYITVAGRALVPPAKTKGA